MKTKSLAPRAPVTVDCGVTLQEAATLMDTANVGALLVMDEERLVGIVTDRDIVVRGVARGYPPGSRIDSVMSTDVVTIDAEADVQVAYKILGSHALRRLPVVDGAEIVGLLSVDDLLLALATDLELLVHPVVGEVVFGHHPAPLPAVP